MDGPTPGPWFATENPGQYCPECREHLDDGKWMVGWKLPGGEIVGLATVIIDDREDANARLIAAAPDLLVALRSVPTPGVYESDHDYAVRMAKWLGVRNAAISKAEGRS